MSAAEAFARLEELFHAARATPPEERAAFLARACGDDAALRAEVESLLAAAARESHGLDVPADADEAEAMPARLGPYRLLARIGRGGSSVVYRAEESGEVRREVALKVVAGVHARQLLRRFEAEKRILASLEHPGIARLYGAGRTDDGLAWLAMEYVEGSDLVSFCEATGATVEDRLRLFLAVLAPVEFAHRNLVVHRDLKPANVVVSNDGQPKLLDFGIAALLDPEEGVAASDTTTLLRAMTPAYASPEQIRGERVATASDVFSLGVVLFELLTGRRPRRDSTTASAVERAFRDLAPDPPSAAARAAGARRVADPRRLEGDLDAIVLKAMSGDPAGRYASVAAFAEDVRRHLDGLPVQARRGGLAYRGGRFAKRHVLGISSTAAVLLLAAAGLGLHLRTLAAERDRANAAAAAARREAARAERMVGLVTGIFDAANPLDQPGRPLTALELLERGGARAEALTGDPDVRAQLRLVLGGIWSQAGSPERATRLVEEAARELKSRRGDEDPLTAQALAALALRRQEAGRQKEALELFERALAVQRRTLGPRDPALATTLWGYGNTLRALGDLGGAREALEAALAAFRAVTPPDDAVLGRVLGNVAHARIYQGDPEMAFEAVQESLERLERTYGKESPRLGHVMLILADIRRFAGRTDLALQILEDVARIHRKNFGATREPSAHLLARLGDVHADFGHVAEARAYLVRAVAAYRRELGSATSGAAWPLRSLARLAGKGGDRAEERRLYEEALAIRTRELGEAHWEVAQSWEDLARLAHERADETEEERCLRRALAILRAARRPSESGLMTVVLRLGSILCAGSAREEGAALLAEGIAALDARAGAAHGGELARLRKEREACLVRPPPGALP